MRALPDVNVLVALAWPNHVHHAAARAWFAAESPHGWATTPMTETGFVRVSANPRAVPGARPPREALLLLGRLCEQGDHEFWLDDVRLREVDTSRMAGYRQVTDAHLVAVADRRGGCLVTFDRGIGDLAGPAMADRVRRLAFRAAAD